MESGKPSFSRSRGSRNVDSEQATTEVNGGRDRNRVRNITFFKLWFLTEYFDPKTMYTLLVRTLTIACL